MYKNIDKIIHIKKRCEEIIKVWEEVKNKLLELSEKNDKLPSPEFSEDGAKIIFKFSNMKAYCHCKFALEYSIIIFGYTDTNPEGKAFDFEIKRFYMDKHGNLYTNLSDNNSVWNISCDEYLDTFFFHILESMQCSVDRMKEEKK